MRSKRMQPLARHAERIEQDAIQVFVQAQHALAEAEQQLLQLQAYREEYLGQLNGGASLSMEQLRNYRAFVDKLGGAIKQAELDIETRKQVCEHRKQAWLETRSRSQALNRVVERCRFEERREEDRREQKDMDEHAQRVTTRSPEK